MTTAISKVGPTYGRKMMKGMLSSHGIHMAEKRLACSMQRVNPHHHQARCTATESQTNPQPYHVDQNENWQCLVLHMLLLLMGTVPKLSDL